MQENKQDKWCPCGEGIIKREARAHERGMVAYSAYLALSKYQEVGLCPAEKAYREAYDYAMGRAPS